MRKQSILLPLAVVFLAFGGMGSECDSTDDPTGDGGTGDVSCRDDGTCTPNLYADSDLGVYDTSNYDLRLLRPDGGGTPAAGRANGEIVLVDGFVDGSAVEYWILSEVNGQGQLVDIFPDSDTFLGELYVFVDESGSPVSGQAPIIGAAPDSNDYSPLFRITEVSVPNNYVPDTIKSVGTILDAAADADTGIVLDETDDVVVVEIVDQSVSLQSPSTGSAPAQTAYWFDGAQVFGYRFEGGNTNGTVPVTEDGAGGLLPTLNELWQFSQAADGAQTCFNRNVFAYAENDPFYSPVTQLYLTNIKGAACSSTPTDADTAISLIGDGTYESDITLTVVTPQVP